MELLQKQYLKKAVLNQISADSQFMAEISKQVTQAGHLLHPLSEGRPQRVRGKGTLPRAAEGSPPVPCWWPQGIGKERESLTRQNDKASPSQGPAYVLPCLSIFLPGPVHWKEKVP